eukprot:CAMPEP_0194395888 /NCGR_PEP_ID=MMETSP0174-20130528/124672_1 /TAXON_ID=216777 /ORGANISM="Proboscia alata, Strain PI-D3" /LENGTH=419 /DNA_ID=CAMNT_0039191871 /DNA_START=32 /DNA_END=1291 /DNA_ORIENTATION=-
MPMHTSEHFNINQREFMNERPRTKKGQPHPRTQRPFNRTESDKGRLVFLHIGKAGGRTIRTRLSTIWKIPFDICHPDPCPKSDFRVEHFRVERSRVEHPVEIICLRDPVDRFVSAFKWRESLLCRPTVNITKSSGEVIQMSESRTPNTRLTYGNRLKYCKDNKPEEAFFVHAKYSSDPNILAEALCDDEERNSNGDIVGIVDYMQQSALSGALATSAVQDVENLGHTKNSITDWLPPTIDGRYSWELPENDAKRTDVIPIVQEPGYNFEEQIDATLEWLSIQDKIDFAYKDTIKDQAKSVKRNHITPRRGVIWSDNEKIMQQQQNSTHLNPDSTPDTKSSLSALGTCCVARYYADDYKLLETIGSALCPNETKTQCQSAINSIIARRQEFLSSDLTCRELSANNNNRPKRNKNPVPICN